MSSPLLYLLVEGKRTKAKKARRRLSRPMLRARSNDQAVKKINPLGTTTYCHYIWPEVFRDAEMRSAFLAFAASIAANSSLVLQVRAGKNEPVTSSFRQIGFGGFVLADGVVGVALLAAPAPMV
jgi:hypothetical protein